MYLCLSVDVGNLMLIFVWCCSYSHFCDALYIHFIWAVLTTYEVHLAFINTVLNFVWDDHLQCITGETWVFLLLGGPSIALSAVRRGHSHSQPPCIYTSAFSDHWGASCSRTPSHQWFQHKQQLQRWQQHKQQQ